jgi:hypothetical protein
MWTRSTCLAVALALNLGCEQTTSVNAQSSESAGVVLGLDIGMTHPEVEQALLSRFPDAVSIAPLSGSLGARWTNGVNSVSPNQANLRQLWQIESLRKGEFETNTSCAQNAIVRETLCLDTFRFVKLESETEAYAVMIQFSQYSTAVGKEKRATAIDFRHIASAFNFTPRDVYAERVGLDGLRATRTYTSALGPTKIFLNEFPGGYQGNLSAYDVHLANDSYDRDAYTELRQRIIDRQRAGGAAPPR